MNREQQDRPLLTYSPIDLQNQTVMVSRVFHDKTTKPIGIVKVHFDSDTEIVTYITSNMQGEELFLPTEDFTEIEYRFEQYAHELNTAYLAEEFDAYVEEYKSRSNALTKLRQWKKILTPIPINR